jgi:ribosome biogenesis GTPase A
MILLRRSSLRCKHTVIKVAISKHSTAAAIIDECLATRSTIQALNDKFKGPLDTTSQKNTVLPFVFLLGNHSSGKSSFINYVLQRKVQVTGVAPTDDSFTIITPGPSDVDRDGPAFVGGIINIVMSYLLPF